ncbi:MAG: hypothetical protein LM593_04795 [Candidatus Verstraetearchaeota archaeon]|nr:hypothetical protein [Candidatus Verstraetearchaeota archaeon]
MIKPIIRLLIIGSMLAISTLFSFYTYYYGKNLIESFQYASAKSIAYTITENILSSLANAKIKGKESSSSILLSQSVLLIVEENRVTVGVGSTNYSIKIPINISITPIRTTILALNITAYPNGTIKIIKVK